MKVSFRRLLAAGATMSAAAALAQEPPTRLEYRSAFEGYRHFRQLEARAWRDANEEARALGGHSGHVKATQPPHVSPGGSPEPGTPAQPPAGSAIDAPKPNGHAGHGK